MQYDNAATMLQRDNAERTSRNNTFLHTYGHHHQHIAHSQTTKQGRPVAWDPTLVWGGGAPLHTLFFHILRAHVFEGCWCSNWFKVQAFPFLQTPHCIGRFDLKGSFNPYSRSLMRRVGTFAILRPL